MNAEENRVMQFIIMTWKSDFSSLCKTQKRQGLIKILRLSHEKSKRCKAAHFWVSDEAALRQYKILFFTVVLHGFGGLVVVKEN